MDKDCWFSGFTDGEGSFFIQTMQKGYGPRFSITLRLDDIGILERLQDSFGGRIYDNTSRSGSPHNSKGHISKPLAQWGIVTKSDLQKIVNYFDRFPLRSKKAGDFKLWREAVQVYVKWGRNDKRLPVLQQAIRDGREFDAVSVSKPYLGPFQQALFEL